MGNSWIRILFLAGIVLAFGGCRTTSGVLSAGARLVDARGQAPRAVAIGENVQLGATGLVPGRAYEFDLMLGDRRVGFARAAADPRGSIEPLTLLYQSGVIGCSGDWEVESRRRPLAFRDFDEAEQALRGRTFQVQLREADPRAIEGRAAFQPSAGRLVSRLALPTRSSDEPMIFPSDGSGCLLNAAEAGSADMHASGRGFLPGETVELAVAPNQIEWHVDDRLGGQTAETPIRVTADARGRFTARVWDRTRQQRGAYDIIARRVRFAGSLTQNGLIHPRDVISYNLDTAYILFLYYPPGGTLMDVAGRRLTMGFPYYEFADSFAKTADDVWGGVDPTYVPSGHPPGMVYAAYYVVPHRTALGWIGATNLTDVSGAVEVGPVKAGCVNGTYRPIWQGNHAVGEYDVVVNFGSVPATSSAAFVDDSNYDSSVDFLDGAIQVGFVVTDDPYELSTDFPIGQTAYSVDDAVALSPSVSNHHGPFPNNVDLRAVVRYPATAAGVDTPVAAGAHPIFIMQHGNHTNCDVYDNNSFPLAHNVCSVADRTRNHEGYMRLLDILASHGIIAVSIDAYDVTGYVPSWIAERGDLNLKHLEFWSHLNNPATYPANSGFAAQTGMANRFNNHVDMSKISISGHSRGGEASVASYMRNKLRPAAQQFAITSVSSIAPVDNLGYTLDDIPFFVILPAADGDVFDLSGTRIYDRAGTSNGQTVKSGIDVYGASHNLFNTVWAADGDDGAPGRDDIIPAADQQKLGEAYVAAFTLSTLKGMTVYEDMLRGKLGFPSTAGRKIYHFRHEKPFLSLDDGTSPQPVATGVVAAQLSLAWPAVHATDVKRLGWSAIGQAYTYSLAPTNVSGFEVLSFRAAQTNSAVNPTGPIDFQVQLSSGSNVRYTYIGVFTPIPKPYNHSGTFQNVMTTVRVPLHSFIMNNSGVNLAVIDKAEIRFLIPTQGEIYVDDVEFSR